MRAWEPGPLSSITHTHGTQQRQPLVPELVYFSTNSAKLGVQEILAHLGYPLKSSDSKEGHVYVYLQTVLGVADVASVTTMAPPAG